MSHEMIALVIATCAFAVALRGVPWLRERAARSRAASQLDAATPASVADLIEGMPARIVGSVQPDGATLRAPFSGRPCVLYVARVDLIDDDGTVVSTEHRDQGAVPFAIRDASGSVRVDAANARVLIAMPRCSPTADADTLIGYLARFGRELAWLMSPTTRLHEAAMAAGETVVVAGVPVRGHDGRLTLARDVVIDHDRRQR